MWQWLPLRCECGPVTEQDTLPWGPGVTRVHVHADGTQHPVD